MLSCRRDSSTHLPCSFDIDHCGSKTIANQTLEYVFNCTSHTHTHTHSPRHSTQPQPFVNLYHGCYISFCPGCCALCAGPGRPCQPLGTHRTANCSRWRPLRCCPLRVRNNLPGGQGQSPVRQGHTVRTHDVWSWDGLLQCVLRHLHQARGGVHPDCLSARGQAVWSKRLPLGPGVLQ